MTNLFLHYNIYNVLWNSKDKFCLNNLSKILLSFLISVLVSDWNWWMNFPKLSWALSDPSYESARDNFGKFIHQFQSETKTLIRKLKRILDNLYRQNLSLLFNETCLNERLLPNYTHTHIYITTIWNWKPSPGNWWQHWYAYHQFE